jgi:hypothetical protein
MGKERERAQKGECVYIRVCGRSGDDHPYTAPYSVERKRRK